MKNRYYSIPLFMLFLLYSHLSSGQDYAADIESATKSYESGKPAECIARLQSITGQSEAPVSYRWQAFKLGSMANLLLGDEKAARVMAVEFMRLNPTYKANAITDSRDFRELIGKLVVIPKFSLGVAATAGTNLTIPNIVASYSTSGYNKTYVGMGSYQFGINVGYSLNEALSLNIGISNTGKAFRSEYSVAPWNYSVTERMQFLEVPLTLKYSFFKNNRTRPYVMGGAYYGYLNSSYNDFKKESPNQLENYSTIRLSSLSRRVRSQAGLLAGAGIYYRLWKGHVNAELGYYRGLTNLTRNSTRYSYIDLIQRYEYIDDDLKLSNMMFSLGYTYYINYRVKEENK